MADLNQLADYTNHDESQSQIAIHIIIGPLILFFLLGFRSLSLDPPIFYPNIRWLGRLLLLLVHFLKIIILVVPSGLIFHFYSFELPRILLIVQAHVLT